MDPYQITPLQHLVLSALFATLDFEALDDIQRFPGLEHLTEEDIKQECDILISQGFVKTDRTSGVYALNIDVIKYI